MASEQAEGKIYGSGDMESFESRTNEQVTLFLASGLYERFCCDRLIEIQSKSGFLNLYIHF
uniref:Uncharacterized protein n=1 Tax=Anguilla anguilla TaxID=7936 RepID=A0A0E9S4H7_ANGAN